MLTPAPAPAQPTALFRHAPELAGRIPHETLGRMPTPVEAIDVASHRILVKRDDLTAPGYGGNKVRKLEFILPEARALGATRLITAGAAGSHHAFATAWHGRRAGFDVSLVLFPQDLTDHVREMLLLDATTGAELRWASRMELVPFGIWRARTAHRSERPFVIPPGGSSVTGTLGYVDAALELAEQIRSGDVSRPSSICVSAGTLGTVAGIAIGLAWAGLDIPVRAVRITSRIVTNERALATLIASTVDRLRAAGATTPDAAAANALVTLQHDQIGTGYGRATSAGNAATEAFQTAGLTLDATYTAKAAAALLAEPGDLPLFWHTLSADAPTEPATPDALPAPFRRYLAGSAPPP